MNANRADVRRLSRAAARCRSLADQTASPELRQWYQHLAETRAAEAGRIASQIERWETRLR